MKWWDSEAVELQQERQQDFPKEQLAKMLAHKVFYLFSDICRLFIYLVFTNLR